MKIYGKSIQTHINTLSSVFDRFSNELTGQEKGSLNAAMQVLDTLERNNGVLILKQEDK